MLIASRFLLVIVGERFWFIGHSILFFILGTYYGFSIIDLKVKPIKPSAHAIDLYVFDSRLEFERNDGRDGDSDKVRVKLRMKYIMLACTFAIFVVDFFIDVLLTGEENDIFITRPHGQYKLGIFAVFLTIINVALKLVFRYYQNADYHITWKVFFTGLIL
eukprot:TRINITY_DN15189_c0_g1_i1.p1 TRINITY_DN15189_c0_g1~~TRINITY_DN15189_c0_g1_i1.p1  ORF type:complete len:161 (-),score=21.63 TRINITY_DN15189_c0_g1_i1:10-492(-)